MSWYLKSSWNEKTAMNTRIRNAGTLDTRALADHELEAVTGGKASHHHASAQVFAHGEGRSRFVWITDVLPDEFAAYIGSMMDQGGDAMKKTLEQKSPASPAG